MPCFDVTVPYKPFSKSIKLSKGITVWAKEKKRKTIKRKMKKKGRTKENKKRRKGEADTKKIKRREENWEGQ